MRIDEIEVKNFRGIRQLKLENLQSTIVIAGANGSGKSCIFDAIRLLKSAYGGYQQNEWHHWMNEFQINFANNNEAFQSFFQDNSKRLSIECRFRLHPAERAYLQSHGEELVRTSVWRLIAPEMYGWSSYRAAPMAAQYRDREEEVNRLTTEQLALMMTELSQETVIGHLWGDAGSEIHFKPSKALEILFSSFVPGELGLIDYHGAQRMYQREQVSNINLDISVQEQQNKQHALYNYSAKYGGVKAEMASSFVKELLAQAAGIPREEQSTLSNTLKELFSTFFPDKKFLGIKPTIDGGVEFPVQTASGAIHDLNELSAGEKEVLYGYLRIRNSAPCYSIILVDEPELHLNPRLTRGLPQFYHQHLGVALDNQIWLVTHSDALLREVLGRPEYSVFHMVGASHDQSAPQIVPITLGEASERALISLVGDIAAYRPGKKVVIFEGGGDSEFDVSLTSRLFPELQDHANLIPSGNKLRVRELHDVLDAAASSGSVPFDTFSITDGDSELAETVTSPRFKWNVYHIENFLLESEFVRQALIDIGSADSGIDQNIVYDKLRSSAQSCLPELVRHEMTSASNTLLFDALSLKFDPKRSDIAVALSEAIARSSERVEELIGGRLKADALTAMENGLTRRFEADLATDNWRMTFRGRDILKRFVKDNTSASYETFRNIIVSRMCDAGFRPAGMAQVVSKIIEA